MSALPVSSLLEAWIADPDVTWEAALDVVDWARPYGADLERAWRECPRADHLVAIAGACGADRRAVVATVAAAAREALAFVPRKEKRPIKAVHFAETYRPGPELTPADLEPAKAIEGAFDPLINALGVDEERLVTRTRAASAEVTRALPSIADAHLAALTATPDPAAGGPDPLAPLFAALSAHPAVRALGAAARDHRLLLAFARAARAARSACVVASSNGLAEKATRKLAALAAEGAHDARDRADVAQFAALERRSGARAYGEAALAFQHAAAAAGDAAAASPEAFARALSDVLGALRVAATTDPKAAPRFGWKARIDAVAAAATLAKHRAYADRLRAAIPFAAIARGAG